MIKHNNNLNISSLLNDSTASAHQMTENAIKVKHQSISISNPIKSSQTNPLLHTNTNKNDFSTTFPYEGSNFEKNAIDSHMDQLPKENYLLRRKFTPEEDHQLKKLIAKYGAKKWNQIALAMPGRSGRQCRDRFANYLNPTLTNGEWSKSEDILLEQKVAQFGQHWNVIAKYFKGRSPNNVKNRWYTYISGQKKRKNIINKNDQIYMKKNEKSIDICDSYYDNANCNLYSNLEMKNSNINFVNSVIGNENDHCVNCIANSENENKIVFPPILIPNSYVVLPFNNAFLGFVNQPYVI